MFVDELTITARAGRGGDGVVRWLQQKFQPKGGPAGGNGGRGGDVYLVAVRDINQLAKYTGYKEFAAADGEDGQKKNQHGHNGPDLEIAVPVGATVYDETNHVTYRFNSAGERQRVLRGGHGGLGNATFKSSTNRSPQQATPGKSGEAATLRIEVSLVVDVGLIGLPNAGKSTLLNTFTNATAATGAYPFTTLEPHLGDLYGFILADIPGLIAGAASGKGLGHTFLKHVARTKMLLHCVSCEDDISDPVENYDVVREEIRLYNKDILEKPEWVIVTKIDKNENRANEYRRILAEHTQQPVYPISAETGAGVKVLRDALVSHLRST